MTRNAAAVNTERHRWGDKDCWHIIAAQDARDGNEHHVRQCLTCSMTKITIITPHGFAWHEWVTPQGKLWFGEITPPCRPVGKVEAAPSREVPFS